MWDCVWVGRTLWLSIRAFVSSISYKCAGHFKGWVSSYKVAFDSKSELGTPKQFRKSVTPVFHGTTVETSKWVEFFYRGLFLVRRSHAVISAIGCNVNSLSIHHLTEWQVEKGEIRLGISGLLLPESISRELFFFLPAISTAVYLDTFLTFSRYTIIFLTHSMMILGKGPSPSSFHKCRWTCAPALSCPFRVPSFDLTLRPQQEVPQTFICCLSCSVPWKRGIYLTGLWNLYIISMSENSGVT